MTKSTEFDVTFTDGSSRRLTRRPVCLMRAEIICGQGAGTQELLLAMLWAADTGGRGTRDEFEAWADSLDSWELVSSTSDADPPENGPGTSPD